MGLQQDSVVAFLERSITELQAEIDQQKSLSAPGSVAGTRLSAAAYERFSNVVQNCMRHDCNASIKGQPRAIYSDVLLTSSTPPRPAVLPTVDRNRSSHTPRTSLDDIPPSVAEILLDIYVEKILPHNAIFLEDEVRELYRRVCVDISAQQRDARDLFMILMVFAISTMCSKCDDFRRPASLAESLHAEAVHYFDCTISSTTSLQCLLLAIQLAYVLPDTGNMVSLVAEAMRMAAELRLHTDPSDGHGRHDAEKRQRLFWQTYIMERSVNSSARQPLVIGDDDIDIPFPQAADLQGTEKWRANFATIIRYRHFQGEIFSRQYRNADLAEQPYDEWMAQKELEVLSWRGRALGASDTLPDWFKFGTSYILLSLHRPSPVNPTPSLASVRECIVAAGHLISGFHHAARNSLFKFTWHALHNCFEGGAILLYNILQYNEAFRCLSNDLFQQTGDVLRELTDFFPIVCERWPRARKTVDLFESLKARVLQVHALSLQGAVEPDLELHQFLRDVIFQKSIGISNIHHGLSLGVNQSHTALSIDLASTEESDGVASWLDAIPNLDIFDDFHFLELPTSMSPWLLPESFDTPSPRPPIPASPAQDAAGMYEPHMDPSDHADAASSFIEEAFDQLPACLKCRRRKIKCDRKFPCCGYCARTNQVCTIVDPVLDQEIPRSRLQQLKQRYDDLSQKLIEGKTREDISFKGEDGRASSSASTEHNDTMASSLLDSSFDTFSKNPKGKTVYVGRSSPLFSLGRALDAANIGKARSIIASIQNPLERASGDLSIDFRRTLTAPEIAVLIDVYHNSIEVLFPGLKQQTLGLMAPGSPEISQHSNLSTRQTTSTNLVLAVAARMLAKRDSRMMAVSTALLGAAMQDYSSFCSEVQQQNEGGLTAVFLLCLYFLLDPSSGDVWRLLGYACRLCTELSWDFSGTLGPEKANWPLRCSVFRLECDVSIAYGLPPQRSMLCIDRSWISAYETDQGAQWTAYYLHRLAVIKLSIHAHILTKHDALADWEVLQERLHRWQSAWKLHIETVRTLSSTDHGMISWLERCGEFYFCEAALFFYRAAGDSSMPLADAHDFAIRYIEAFSILYKGHHHISPTAAIDGQSHLADSKLVFPIWWTAVHSLFHAGIVLIHRPENDKKRSNDSRHQQAVQTTLWLLECLSIDRGNLCDGLADELQYLKDHVGA
ncbi:hypothetical protein NA57DRAFT_74836 [Rhizodiscina lignyota]|uniref:Zn(2)-C6 fungal-type domain-containing protein n=1 Tax=Rhizodiscina lignyota TaxID=1504668 RepID=A0A9P4ID20_9PEZI|nr:hypothetical protein NA57DRAFT_74836 [Rhizodiscina lignyota]